MRITAIHCEDGRIHVHIVGRRVFVSFPLDAEDLNIPDKPYGEKTKLVLVEAAITPSREFLKWIAGRLMDVDIEAYHKLMEAIGCYEDEPTVANNATVEGGGE